MAKKLIFFPILILTMFLLANYSQANVLVDDADSDTETDQNVAFTSADVPTGSGLVGDYELIACGISIEPNLTFSDPVPGTWTELDMALCGGFGDCEHGIWGRFTDNPASEDITCSWDTPSFVFAGGSFRYNDVDPDDPIIDILCDDGFGFGENIMATAPSINTVEGSQVTRIYTYRNFMSPATSDVNFNNDTSGSFLSIATVLPQAANFPVNVTVQGETELVLVEGPTGPASVNAGFDAQWRACTIALRMAPQPRNVPTMSEWGLIAFAACAGIAGFWYLRRRQVTA